MRRERIIARLQIFDVPSAAMRLDRTEKVRQDRQHTLNIDTEILTVPKVIQIGINVTALANQVLC